MNRRRFLAALGVTAAAIALDPEQLLWRPGAKTIFLPATRPTTLAFHKDAFWIAMGEFPFPPAWQEGIRLQAKALADRIDRSALMEYERVWNEHNTLVMERLKLPPNPVRFDCLYGYLVKGSNDGIVTLDPVTMDQVYRP